MNIEDVRKILQLVREHELTEFELEQDGLKVRVKKDNANQWVMHASPPLLGASQPAVGPKAVAGGGNWPPALVEDAPVGAASEAEEPNLAVVKSPIVGTFYRAAEPGAPPYVDLGTPVRKGQALCIIEAMKLMNEIESEYEGEVAKIYVENGQPVQYGERLVAIKVA